MGVYYHDMVNAYASESHYAAHILPIWEAMPSEIKGHFYVEDGALDSVGSTAKIGPPPDSNVLVASYKDLKVCHDKPCILVEHGASQTYLGPNGKPDRNPSNAGGEDRRNVVLFICPNEECAQANRKWYPKVPSVVVGSTVLDRWHGVTLPEPDELTVCISFKWPNSQCPEAFWAWPHYERFMPTLAAAFPKVIGHAHPRAFGRLAPQYERAGIEPVRSFDEVLWRSSIFCMDNSSAMYEFAAIADRPVVALNSPKYRRDVEHGLRFWDLIPGLECDGPEELIEVIFDSLEDPPHLQKNRREVVKAVYGELDGGASKRAVESILTLLKEAK